LPDGSSHIDWLLARDDQAEQRLITFRLDQRVDALKPGARLNAERIADHRPMYLDYEGPISGDRGRVVRLARGTIEHWRETTETWEIEIDWRGRDGDAPPRSQRLRLREEADARWIVFAF
jgi:hypothetical protein